jgi:hypothetical protein
MHDMLAEPSSRRLDRLGAYIKAIYAGKNMEHAAVKLHAKKNLQKRTLCMLKFATTPALCSAQPRNMSCTTASQLLMWPFGKGTQTRPNQSLPSAIKGAYVVQPCKAGVGLKLPLSIYCSGCCTTCVWTIAVVGLYSADGLNSPQYSHFQQISIMHTVASTCLALPVVTLCLAGRTAAQQSDCVCAATLLVSAPDQMWTSTMDSKSGRLLVYKRFITSFTPARHLHSTAGQCSGPTCACSTGGHR